MYDAALSIGVARGVTDPHATLLFENTTVGPILVRSSSPPSVSDSDAGPSPPPPSALAIRMYSTWPLRGHRSTPSSLSVFSSTSAWASTLMYSSRDQYSTMGEVSLRCDNIRSMAVSMGVSFCFRRGVPYPRFSPRRKRKDPSRDRWEASDARSCSRLHASSSNTLL